MTKDQARFSPASGDSRVAGGKPAMSAGLDDSFVTGGGLAVGGALSLPGVRPVIAEVKTEGVPARLAGKDATLWGEAAQAEASIRLGWLDLPHSSRELVPRLSQLRAELVAEGLDHIVLAGMGGSSLAPEVITRTLGISLTVLDTTDPGQIKRALTDRLDRTVVVVSSKSGTTVETDSHRRTYWQAFLDAGLDADGAASRFVIVTDPGSPLASTAQAMGSRGARAIFLADPNVGGRYSALSAFGLVPAALAGVNVAELLAEAAIFAETLADGGPALALGVALGVAASAGKDKVVLAEDGSGIVGLGDWAEQLLAESTGKVGTGILPVVVESPTAAQDERNRDKDRLVAMVGGAVFADHIPENMADLTVNGPLGAQFLAWEYATAVAGRLLQINPFDQPNVAESKENTSRILGSGFSEVTPAVVDGAIEIYGNPELLQGARTAASALAAVLGAIPSAGYLAIMAYLDRTADAVATELRPLVARRTDRPVTFGWGPPFLHSTGQYHKGGPQNGVFVQLTGTVSDDVPVPGQPFSFGQLQAAQADGDLAALTGRRRPVLRLHLTDRAAGLTQLLEALR